MRLRSDAVTSRRVGDDIVVLDLRSSTYFAVSGSGVLLFELLGERECDEDELVQALRAEYDVAEETARLDVSAFVKRLSDADLLSV